MSEVVVASDVPLWVAMEQRIAGLGAGDLESDRREAAIRRLAKELDETGHTVSTHAGNMLQLRWAVEARAKVGRPLLEDFDAAVAALTLDDLECTGVATIALVRKVGEAWPRLKELDRRPDILAIVEKRKLDLVVARAKEMAGDQGVRFLIARKVPRATVVETLGIGEARYDEVVAAIEAERAEKARVEKLLGEVADRDPVARARHLITNDVADLDIIALAGLDQATIDDARQAMVAELEEKRRLAEEAEAAKKLAAEGPALDAIPPAEMLDYIAQIREIMEFSDVEAEIRTMCQQSSIPKSLVDAVAGNPGKLDELEQAAQG